MAGTQDEKKIRWPGSSYHDLLAFPVEPRRLEGMNSMGAGMREIRIRAPDGIFRMMYVSKLPEAFDVLHCFQRQTQQLGRHDGAIAETRYRAVINHRKPY